MLVVVAVLVVVVAGVVVLVRPGKDSAAAWRPQFPDGHELITNELAHHEPDTPGVRTSPDWVVTSGSLFADDGGASTGPVDGDSPDAASRSATGSAVFRALTVPEDFLDVEVTLDLRIEDMTTTDRTGRQDFDGVHLMLRYAGPDELYTVDLCRRDDTATIKKKVPDGGGTYHTLAEVPFACVQDRWETYAVWVGNEADGVRLTLWAGGHEVISGLDDGVDGHPPLTGAGRVGVRGDNTEFRFREFAVCPAGELAADPPQLFCRAR